MRIGAVNHGESKWEKKESGVPADIPGQFHVFVGQPCRKIGLSDVIPEKRPDPERRGDGDRRRGREHRFLQANARLGDRPRAAPCPSAPAPQRRQRNGLHGEKHGGCGMYAIAGDIGRQEQADRPWPGRPRQRRPGRQGERGEEDQLRVIAGFQTEIKVIRIDRDPDRPQQGHGRAEPALEHPGESGNAGGAENRAGQPQEKWAVAESERGLQDVER
ncbi:MAG: hypothetical protein BWZ10_02571 [candidate division BRC1 bacterium ADurb.BinA364]|nr:MAG: hypothetical protein BWZ10_02571 [candidate division BRC1 bacterium ADurb.BinA364]